MNGTPLDIGRINFPAARREGSVLRTDGFVGNTLRGNTIDIFVLNYFILRTEVVIVVKNSR